MELVDAVLTVSTQWRMGEATGIKIQVKGEAVYLLNVRLKISEERELEGEAS
jgi:hypothetical protein